MSKKVVRLTESQLRLMINNVIKEQATPSSSPTIKQGKYLPSPLKMTNNDYIVKEILENLSNNVLVFNSKVQPTKIVTITEKLRPVRGSNNINSFEDKYTADHYQRQDSDVQSVMRVEFKFISDSLYQGGDITCSIELYENSIQTALEKLNKNQGVVRKIDVIGNNTNESTPLSIVFLQMYYNMGQNIKAAYDLISRAQPNILNNLRESLMRYAREQKVKESQDEIYNYVRELDSVTGKQQPQGQPQQKGQQPQK